MEAVLIEVSTMRVANDGVDEFDIVIENDNKKVILDPAERGPWLVTSPGKSTGTGYETIWFII